MGVVCKTMASNASLSGFRKKLVTCIDDLRTRREALNESIREAEMQKIDIENKLPRLSMELSRSNDKIERLDKSQQQIDEAISQISACNESIKGAKDKYKSVVAKEAEYHQKKRMPHGNGSNVAASE